MQSHTEHTRAATSTRYMSISIDSIYMDMLAVMGLVWGGERTQNIDMGIAIVSIKMGGGGW